MARRIENVIDGVVSETTEIVVDVPRGNFDEVQFVIDRTRFEQPVRTPGDRTLCEVQVWSGTHYIGGCGFGDLRVEEVQRPGQRMLWSTGRWPLPDVPQVRFVLLPRRSFDCLMHVDFL